MNIEITISKAISGLALVTIASISGMLISGKYPGIFWLITLEPLRQELINLPSHLRNLFSKNSGLTPQKLAKKASSFAKASAATSEDIAKYDIYQACEYGATERVKELLQDPNLDINKARSYQSYGQPATETPLQIACKKQHPEIVKLLLSRTDIQVNQEDDNGDTSLLSAYSFGHKYSHTGCEAKLLSVNLEIVKILLEDQRVDINHTNKSGKNILSLACKDNNDEFIKQLLRDSRIKIDNNYPLCEACKNQNVEIVKLLLERNVNNCMNINENVEHAIFTNPLLIICLRIRKYDKDLKQEEWCNARQSIADKMMNFLLDKTTSQKIQKIKINRAQCVEIFTLLLNDPAISIDTPKTCITALHLCTSDDTLLSALLARSKESINEFSSYSSLFNSYIGQNYTPLHMAMMEGSLESILLLIEHGADRTIKNKENASPLDSLCNHNSTNHTNISLFRTLLEKELITKKDLDENHCLVKLINETYRNNNEIPKLLLEHGANPNQYKPSRPVSPLFAAAYYDLSLLNLCLDRYNGNYKQKNERGETILYTAFMHKIVKHFHHLNFLKKLNPQERKEYMLYELNAATQYDSRSIQKWHSSFEHYSANVFKNEINNFSLFLNKCICFGNINLIAPSLQLGSPAEDNDAGANKSLLDLTYENMPKQLSSDPYDQNKHLYKEVILHAFMRCVKPKDYPRLSDDLKVHYQLMQTYKENPYEYYRYLDLPKKITQQKYLRNQITSEVHNHTSNKTGSLSAITCDIF